MRWGSQSILACARGVSHVNMCACVRPTQVLRRSYARAMRVLRGSYAGPTRVLRRGSYAGPTRVHAGPTQVCAGPFLPAWVPHPVWVLKVF